MRVIIVGAGLGGLTLAHGLRTAGIEVVVYERDGARGRTQGVSLHMDERGTTALRECLPPPHFAMAQATMGPPRDRTVLLSEGLAVVGTRVADSVMARPGRQTSRRLLRAVLLTGLDDAVRFEAAFLRYELRADDVQAWFADGSVETADVLVGADGVGSAVRRQFLPHVQVIDTGRRMLMGATPVRAVAHTGLLELIGDNAASVQADGMMMALGPHRFLEPPLVARDRWLPAVPAAALADAEDYLMWCMPTTGQNVDARDLAAGLHPTLRNVVDQAWPQLTVPLRIGVIPPMAAWPTHPVTVIGDAIHVAPGFGGNLAMQDARRLRDALVRADRGELSLLDAIGSYEERMRQDNYVSERTA
ncbi:FAD-dependent oxidoreductase [Fodinicola acaciae]|uniref:FAD-dependent oxidoreductase n=1 Tax=Fodinicola acaciae TaxID=2681555 RepID=UPI0013D8444F|nr:FAD-dependent monooxygenase [Fodinicola acaciae]